MIKHSLRIGNKVKVFGKIYTIKELCEFEAAVEETHGVFVYSDVQGVELTGVLLIALGFEKSSRSIWWHRNSFLSFWQTDKGFFTTTDAGENYANSFGVAIIHLHHLQNVVRDLTGTELTINLEQVKV